MGCRAPCRPPPRRASCSTSMPPAPSSPRCMPRRACITRAGLEIVLIGHAGHPEVVGTLGQLPAGAATLHRDDGRRAPLHPARPQAARLHHADHPVGRRHGCHRRDPEAALSRHRRPQEGRHLLCHHQPPGGGQGHCRPLRPADRGGRAQQLQLAAAGRGRRARGLPQGVPGAACRRYSLGPSSKASPRSASPPAHRPRSCSSTRSSMPSAPASRFVSRTSSPGGAHRLQRAARAARGGRRALSPSPRRS